MAELAELTKLVATLSARVAALEARLSALSPAALEQDAEYERELRDLCSGSPGALARAVEVRVPGAPRAERAARSALATAVVSWASACLAAGCGWADLGASVSVGALRALFGPRRPRDEQQQYVGWLRQAFATPAALAGAASRSAAMPAVRASVWRWADAHRETPDSAWDELAAEVDLHWLAQAL